MALRQTRLYYNTGFNAGNTPGNVSILNSANYIDLEAHWDYQDFFLSSLKLKATWDQVKNADYLKYGEGYYWITGVSMINTNTAELYLQLDALATLGGAETLTYKQGILKRAHPLIDSPFDNTLPEPISPQRSLYCTNDPQTVVEIDDTAVYDTFILSTLSLTNDISFDANGLIQINDDEILKAYTYLDNEDAKVTIPRTPAPAEGFTVNDNINVPYDMYKLTEDTRELLLANIAYLRSLGLEQAILGCYCIPHIYAKNIKLVERTGRVKEVENRIGDINKDVTGWDQESDGFRSRWTKSKTMYNTYVMQSLLSGEIKEYKTEDIIYDNKVTFKVAGDKLHGGKPYCWPRYYHSRDNATVYGANGISGIEWLELPLVFNGASGSRWLNNKWIMDRAESATNSYFQAAHTANNFFKTLSGEAESLDDTTKGRGGSGLNVTNMVGGFIDTTIESIKQPTILKYHQQKLEHDWAQSSIQTPGITTTSLPGLQTTIPNDFTYYHFMMSASDRQKFDKFFDLYGYAQDCTFDKQYITTDIKNLGYNYIEAQDVHIARTGRASQCGIAIKDLAEKQLCDGIRIWHRLA